MEASSPRREQVEDYKRAQGIDGARAGQIAAHRTRPRRSSSRQRRYCAGIGSWRHGEQAERVVAAARERGLQQVRAPEIAAREAVTYARDHLFERALSRGMGRATHGDVRREIERRTAAVEFRAV